MSHPRCQQSSLDDTSTWLTSFAVKVLARAERSSNSVFVDSQFLFIKPLEWLKNAQDEDGCFEMERMNSFSILNSSFLLTL